MIKFLKKTSWSPYTVGAGIGLLMSLAYLIIFKILATSTAFVRLAAFLIGIFSVDYVIYNEYFSRFVASKPVFEWQVFILLGILIGAFISTKLSGITFSFIPYQWGQTFGFSKPVRAIGAFIGGALLIVGARIAGGCTLSLTIAGGLELATQGWLFIVAFFTTGIITAHILYKK